MDAVDYVDKYLKEYPADEMIFQEMVQRADLSPAEEKVLWEAIGRYCAAIVEFKIDSLLKMLDNWS